MAKHTAKVPEPVRATHTLELTDDEAYQIWRLSMAFEGGPDFPAGFSSGRVHNFFGDETRARFARERAAGRKVKGAHG